MPGVGSGWLSIVGPAQYFSPITIQNPGVRLAGSVVPIPYATALKGATTSGIIGVDAQTGVPAWAFSAAPSPTTDRAMVTAVAASVVLATVSAPYGPRWPATSPTTIAIDAKTGTELWRETGLTGLSGDGDAVVVARRTANSATWLPEVRDARTGKARWTGTNAVGGPYDHEQTAAGFVLLKHGDRGIYDLVRLSTGDQLDVPEETRPVLVGTEPPLLAWDGGMNWFAKGPNGFVTQKLPKGRAAKGKHRPDTLTFEPALGVGPYLWGELQSKMGSKEEEVRKSAGTVALDRTGAPCSPAMRDGAAIADVSSQWLLLGLKDHLAVHRIQPA